MDGKITSNVSMKLSHTLAQNTLTGIVAGKNNVIVQLLLTGNSGNLIFLRIIGVTQVVGIQGLSISK